MLLRKSSWEKVEILPYRFFPEFYSPVVLMFRKMRKITRKQKHLSKISVHCIKIGAGSENI